MILLEDGESDRDIRSALNHILDSNIFLVKRDIEALFLLELNLILIL